MDAADTSAGWDRDSPALVLGKSHPSPWGHTRLSGSDHIHMDRSYAKKPSHPLLTRQRAPSKEIPPTCIHKRAPTEYTDFRTRSYPHQFIGFDAFLRVRIFGALILVRVSDFPYPRPLAERRAESRRMRRVPQPCQR